MKAVLMFLLGVCLTSTYAGGIVSTLDHASLEGAIRGGGLVQITASGSILLTNSISVSQNTVIEGLVPNIILDGGGSIKAFTVSNAHLTLRNLIVSNCVNNTGTVGSSYYGGAISAVSASLTLLNCTFSHNQVGGRKSGGTALGGAIYANDSQLFITNSAFVANSAQLQASFIVDTLTAGGALFIENSLLHGSHLIAQKNTSIVHDAGEPNAMANGGGLITVNSDLKIVQSYFSGNTVSARNAYGGAVFVDSASDISIGTSLFSANAAVANPARRAAGPAHGGAIANGGTLTLLNTVLANNSVNSPLAARGGAVFNEGSSFVTGCSLIENRALGQI